MKSFYGWPENYLNGKLEHPQIPRLLDYFEERQSFYLVQDFVSGITLHQEIRKEGLFNEDKIRKFLVEILPIIQYVHSKEIIHRDIKPANIIRRDQDNKLVLIDFGAVKS
jgi:serine/threonine protein kinase, bacterial